MNVLVLGATGKLGKLIVANLLAAKDDVNILVRNIEEAKSEFKGQNVKYIQGDAKNVDDLLSAFPGFDVFVSAFSTTSETKLVNVTKNIIEAAKATGVRGVIVSGASTLYLDKSKTTRLVDDLSQVPTELQGSMLGHVTELDLYLSEDGIKVSIFSPALDFEYPGKLTKKYAVGDDVAIYNHNNQSLISYLDGAYEITKEIHKPQHLNKRWTIGYTN